LISHPDEIEKKKYFIGQADTPQYHLPELRGRFRITTQPSPDGQGRNPSGWMIRFAKDDWMIRMVGWTRFARGGWTKRMRG